MHLLRDDDIIQLLESDSPFLTNISKPCDWYAEDSLVQPSSLDLHIGTIFIPPEKEPSPQDRQDRRTDYILEPGQTVVVTTLETLRAPDDIALFGFPPTNISNRAILMTNPGHVDPGFEGHLSFTLINMGRKSFHLTQGMAIVTLLMVKLEKPVSVNWKERNPDVASAPPGLHDLYKLGRDFLDIDNRAGQAAEQVVRREDINIRRMQIWLPLIAALISAVVAFGASWLQFNQQIANLETEIEALKTQIDFDDRIDRLETEDLQEINEDLQEINENLENLRQEIDNQSNTGGP